jgi:hypothetical protein
MTSLDGLPDDPSGVRDAVWAMRAELAAERALRQRLEDQNERLRHFIRQLQRMQFGRRSEKLDPDQLALALEDLEQAVAEADAEAEKTDPEVRRARGRERRRSRGALPEHLPRIEVVIEPSTTLCPCCASAMHVIGEDRSERLDVIPMRYLVVNRRAKGTPDRRAKGTPVPASMRACPGSEQEGPARAAQCLRERRSGARGRCLFAHLGKPGVGSGEGGRVSAQARFLKRQDSLPVSMISQ